MAISRDRGVRFGAVRPFHVKSFEFWSLSATTSKSANQVRSCRHISVRANLAGDRSSSALRSFDDRRQGYRRCRRAPRRFPRSKIFNIRRRLFFGYPPLLEPDHKNGAARSQPSPGWAVDTLFSDERLGAALERVDHRRLSVLILRLV